MFPYMVVNVKIRNICHFTSMVMYSFFWVRDSLDRWDWLARSMSGKSRVVKATSGADRESEKKTSEELRL